MPEIKIEGNFLPAYSSFAKQVPYFELMNRLINERMVKTGWKCTVSEIDSTKDWKYTWYEN